MRFITLLATSTITFVSAIKQGVKTQEDGYMGQTKTQVDYALENLDNVVQEIETWYQTTGVPTIESHKKQVFEAALAEVEQRKGQLLETCDEGTQCRDEVMADLKATIKESWKTIITDLKDEIDEAVQETRTIVKEGWKEKIECQVNHPCCQYSEVEWFNNVKYIKKSRQTISKYVEKWEEFEQRRIDLEKLCPISLDHHAGEMSCEEVGPCSDGEPRTLDHHCTCPPAGFAPCPETACASGIPREPSTCECHEQPPNRASVPSTHYEGEAVTVTWDSDANLSQVHKFEVYVEGRLLTCEEEREAVVATSTCTVGVDILLNEPWKMAYETSIYASVRTVYDDFSTSGKTELGNGAKIPSEEYFFEKTEVWSGEYVQFEVGHTMVFYDLYVSQKSNLVIGGGLDDAVGEFFLHGTREGQQVSFQKIYLEPLGYQLVYEGVMSDDEHELIGNWALYWDDGSKGLAHDKFTLSKHAPEIELM